MARYTLKQLENLEKAIAQGVTRVTYNDKTVEYRSLDEMNKLRQLMMKDLGLIKQTNQRIKLKYDRDGD